MNQQFFLRCVQQLWLYAWLVVLGLLAACGGGGISSAGGVGSGGSGVAEGSVSGFGSVIVDGVSYDDSNASVLLGNAQGGTDLAQAKLGQRVRISQSQTGVADQITVLPQLRGTADSAADSDGWFLMLGQWVHIISADNADNADNTRSTSTVLDGLAVVAQGDALEVHGTWVYSATKASSVLVATRIEKLAAAPDPVLLSAVVRARSGNLLTLDDAKGTSLQYKAMPDSVAAQSLVSAWVAQSALAVSPRVATRLVDASPQPSGDGHLLLGSQISSGNAANGTVNVQGLQVTLPDSLKSNPPAPGTFVQMDIVRSGTGWQAVSVTQRQSGSDLGGLVELKGTLNWPAQTGTLTLRDVSVTVPSGVLDAGCKALATGDRVYVSVKAQRTTPGQAARATSVVCTRQVPGNSVIEVSGLLTQITPNANGSTGSLVLTTPQGVQTLKWTAKTLLPKDLNAWLNRQVEVEYQVVNGENRLRRIKLD